MKFATIIFASLLFVGCGGGGGSGDNAPPAQPVVSTLGFPLEAAYKAHIASGATDQFVVSGSCRMDSITFSTSMPVATTFQGLPAFSATRTIASYTSDTSCYYAGVRIYDNVDYFDANYTLLGSSILGLNQNGVVTTTIPVAASVHVGDTASFATMNVYKHTRYGDYGVYGSWVVSYIIEADTATTAIVNLITKGYEWDCIDRVSCPTPLVFTQQKRYRITAEGALTLISVDIQYSSGIHLLFTKI